MTTEKRWCADCRWLELRIEAAGPATYYWCSKTRESLGGSVAEREACDESEPKTGRPARRAFREFIKRAAREGMKVLC